MIFLSEHWKTYNPSQMQGLSNMFVTSKEKYHKLSVVCVECVALESDHEEADTRVLLATCQICNEHMRFCYCKKSRYSPDPLHCSAANAGLREPVLYDWYRKEKPHSTYRSSL